MESLGEFVNRFSGSVGCHYHSNRSNVYSLKRFDSNQKGKMGVLGWVSELKGKDLFRVDTYKRLGDKAGASDLADGIKENMHFNKEGIGIFFHVKRGGHGEDYQKAVESIRAIMALK